MKEFLLGFFLAADKLDVVDNQYVHIAIFLFNILHALIPDRPHDVAREFFGRDIARTYLVVMQGSNFVSQCLEQMGFPKANSPVKKERIVFYARIMYHGFCGGKRELIRGAYDE